MATVIQINFNIDSTLRVFTHNDVFLKVDQTVWLQHHKPFIQTDHQPDQLTGCDLWPSAALKTIQCSTFERGKIC